MDFQKNTELRAQCTIGAAQRLIEIVQHELDEYPKPRKLHEVIEFEIPSDITFRIPVMRE